MTNLEKQFKENEAAFKKLGLDMPTDLETIKASLSKHQKESISKDTAQLVITPATTEEFGFYDLLDKFKVHYDLWVYDAIWDQYAPELKGPASISVVSRKADNEYGDAFVQHTNKTLGEQRKVKAELLGPVESVILIVILKLQGEDLAPNTWIRFAGLDNKAVGGYSLVGCVDSVGGQSYFGRGGGHAHPHGGLGVLVGQKIAFDPQDSALISSFSSESLNIEITEVKINGKIYRLES